MGFENKAWLDCRTFRLRHHRVGRASLSQLPRGIGCVVRPTYLLSAPVCCLRARFFRRQQGHLGKNCLADFELESGGR
jgi:hypothetical protein